MWGNNARLQPSRPPPPFDPVVEAWLDSLPPPATKPSLKELRQWRLSNYHGLGRSVFVTCIILRAVSLTIALSVTGLTASVVAKRQGPWTAVERLVPALVVCPVVALWSTAEFTAAYVVGDGGLAPNVHVVIDSILFLGVATAMGTLLVDVICGLTDFGATFDTAGEEISGVCLLVVLMVIHSFLLFFFICNYVDTARRKSKPLEGRSPTPRYADVTIPWPHARQAADPFTILGTPKLGQITTMMELEEFEPNRRHEDPDFGISVHPGPPIQQPPAADLESAALAQAMSGLWYVEGGPSLQPRPQCRDEDAIISEADQRLSQKVRYA